MEGKIDRVVEDVSDLKEDHQVLREIIFGDGDKNVGLSGKVLILQKSVADLEDKIRTRDRLLLAFILIFVTSGVGVFVLLVTGQLVIGPVK